MKVPVHKPLPGRKVHGAIEAADLLGISRFVLIRRITQPGGGVHQVQTPIGIQFQLGTDDEFPRDERVDRWIQQQRRDIAAATQPTVAADESYEPTLDDVIDLFYK